MFPVYAQQIKDWTDSTKAHTGQGVDGCLVDGVPTLKCIEVLFNNIIVMASASIVLVLFCMFLVGAFNWMTAFGNPEKLKKAQGTIKYAVIGLVIFVSAYLILNFIDIILLGGRGDIFRLNIGG
ncbi:MAG: pilin [Candidatus Roizmanbacteria bacterium]